MAERGWLKQIDLREMFLLALRLARRLGAEERECEDVAQESLIKAIECYEPEREKRAAFSTYLYKVTVSGVRALKRSAPVRRTTLSDDVGEGRDEKDAGHERALLRRALCEAIDALPDNQWVIFYLHEFEGLSVREIAELCGLSEARVRARLKKAHETLVAWGIKMGLAPRGAGGRGPEGHSP